MTHFRPIDCCNINSVPISISGLLPIKYVHHFQLLSASTYILLNTHLTTEDIAKAEAMLNNFADEFEILYGLNAVTMNLHLLRHIPKAVRDSGPLWTHSLFGFESNNGVLAKSTNGNNRILEEMATKYIFKRTLSLERTKCQAFDSNLCNLIGVGRKRSLNERELSTFSSHGMKESNVRTWGSMRRNGQLFTSKIYKEVKSIDYFVSMSDGSLGVVQYFFTHDDLCYLFLENFEVIHTVDHLLEVKSVSVYSIHQTENIDDKLLFMKINGKYVVTRIPNRYEKT